MARCRVKLYGKRATHDDFLEEIYRLLYAKGERPYAIRPTEIAKVLGICRQTVYTHIKKLAKRGDMIRLPSGRFILPKSDGFREFNKLHSITSDPLVSEWMDDLLTRRQGSA